MLLRNEFDIDFKLLFLYTIYCLSNRGKMSEIADIIFGSLAQLGEHLPYKQGVVGSIPTVPTKKDFVHCTKSFFCV